jgi:hypothetical protein
MASGLLVDRKTNAAAAARVSGGVLETREGQMFFLELMHRPLAEMRRGVV